MFEHHGGTGTTEYSSWHAMKDRCLNPSGESWERYGGRGILLWEPWANSFEAFLQDMGYKPAPHYSIEREDNDGHYAPYNCRWGTREEQRRNRHNSLYLETSAPEPEYLLDVAKRLGVSRQTVYSRHRRGTQVDTPVRQEVVVTYQGNPILLAELARQTGLDYYMLYQRIFVNGFTPEDAVSRGAPVAKFHRYEGEDVTLKVVAARAGVAYASLRYYVNDRGQPLEEALSYLLSKKKG